MKVTDLFEAKRVATDKGYYTPGYDTDAKNIKGTVKDWLARLEASPEDVAEAMKQAMELPSYKVRKYDWRKEERHVLVRKAKS